MSPFMRFVNAIGLPIIAFVIAVPVLAGGAMAVMAPRIVSPNYLATTTVPVALISGTHASYEASSYAADFRTTLSMPTAADAAAAASGQSGKDVAADLAARHEGDTTYVMATFQSPTEEGAGAGLQAAVGTALSEMANRTQQRAEIELTSAQEARDQVMREMSTTSTPPSGVSEQLWADSQSAIVRKASERVSDAQSNLSTSRLTQKLAGSIGRELQVSTEQISTRTDQIRMTVTAAITAGLIALALATLVKWLGVRRRDAQSGELRE